MRAVVLCLVLAACAEPGAEVADWTLVDERARHAIRLPSLLVDALGTHEVPFTLQRRIEIAPTNQPQTLVIQCFHGPVKATVNGVDVPDFGDVLVGEHRFVIGGELAKTGVLDVTLDARITWGVYATGGFPSAPRLVPGVVVKPSTAARFNRALAIVSLAVLCFLAAIFAATSLLDRQRAGLAAAVAMVFALPMILCWQIGVLHSWNLVAATLSGMAVGISLLALLVFIHASFGLGRVPRIWNVLLGALVVSNLANLSSLEAVAVVDRATQPIVVAAQVYAVFLLVRVLRKGRYRLDALILLIGWVLGIGFAAFEFVLPEPLGERPLGPLHAYSIAVTLQAITLALVLGRQYGSRQRALEHTAQELRHQVASRSRELAETLARLASESSALDNDRMVDGRYRVVHQIGAGGMGTVYEVERTSDARRFALKSLRGRANTEAAARLAREAQIAAGLDHPNLVPVIDVGVDQGAIFLVMPLVENGALDVKRAGDIPWARRTLAQIARGLAALHARGIVHRDLKPANILVADGVAMIADFGLAFDDSSPELTQARVAMGTRRYMAPETLDDARMASPSSDVYAFGVMACELLGSLDHVGSPLRDLLERCLGDRETRPTAEELARTLEAPS
jgi:hypothetical protein